MHGGPIRPRPGSTLVAQTRAVRRACCEWWSRSRTRIPHPSPSEPGATGPVPRDMEDDDRPLPPRREPSGGWASVCVLLGASLALPLLGCSDPEDARDPVEMAPPPREDGSLWSFELEELRLFRELALKEEAREGSGRKEADDLSQLLDGDENVTLRPGDTSDSRQANKLRPPTTQHSAWILSMIMKATLTTSPAGGAASPIASSDPRPLGAPGARRSAIALAPTEPCVP